MVNDSWLYFVYKKLKINKKQIREIIEEFQK